MQNYREVNSANYLLLGAGSEPKQFLKRLHNNTVSSIYHSLLVMVTQQYEQGKG